MAVLHPSPPFDELTYYPIEKWVRGMRGGDTIVDTRRALLVWEVGKTGPIYAFPAEDVNGGTTGEGEPLPVRSFDDPDLAGCVTVAWDALEHWYEEDEEVFSRPRDPFVRLDALRSSRHVRVEREGNVLAESNTPILLFETGVPTRYYLPATDVDPSRLESSELQTGCQYKGVASYRDVVIDGRRHPSLFWYYQAPFHEVSKIAGYLAPYSERVDLIVDGQLQERPAGPLGRKSKFAKRAA